MMSSSILMDIWKVEDEVYAVCHPYRLRIHLMHLTGPEPRTLYTLTSQSGVVNDGKKFWIELYNKYLYNHRTVFDDVMIIIQDKDMSYDKQRFFIYDSKKNSEFEEITERIDKIVRRYWS